MKNTFILLLALLPATQAKAFDTYIHRDITQEVLPNLGFDRKAVDQVVFSNEETDNDDTLNNIMHAHYCNEEFSAGGNRLRTKLEEALVSLTRCDREKALAAIGTSLHAIQDFYSHSNAVTLYRDGKTTIDLFHLQDPKPNVVCSPERLPNQLTSAYWPDNGNFPGKCTHEQIAKDNPTHGQYHYIARARAVLATALYIQQVRMMVKQVFVDSEDRIQFLNSGRISGGNACRPATKLRLERRAWLPALRVLMKQMPHVLLPN